MAKCMYCSREADEKTKFVGGYEILESCTGCEEEINKEVIIEITKGLQIKKVNGLRFGNHLAYNEARGYAFYHEDLGYMSFKKDNESKDAKVPYIPLGGKRALEYILDTGGLIHYDDIEWLQPINS